MSLVLDSNILVGLVTGEACSLEAKETVAASLRDGCTLHTVDAALVEVLNALWKHVKTYGDLDAEEAQLAAQDLLKIWDRLNVIPHAYSLRNPWKHQSHGTSLFETPSTWPLLEK